MIDKRPRKFRTEYEIQGLFLPNGWETLEVRPTQIEAERLMAVHKRKRPAVVFRINPKRVRNDAQ